MFYSWGRGRTVPWILILLGIACVTRADDWPAWRHDSARTAISQEVLPGELHLQWTRDYRPLRPAYWQVRQQRLQFDLGYEPVVAGGTMFVASSRNDRVTALDAATGVERWRFYTEGPVRFAPVAWDGRLYVGSDDGHLYCLDAGSGKLLWKRRATPSSRKVLGNGRLISVWPVRGGPAVADGRVYFAAGVWPFEGIFVYALDARTGDVIWLNDRSGSRYCIHPHGAASFGGPSPQGYLVVRGDELIVPSGRAFPAVFDRQTGELRSFDFGHQGHGSIPGSWFVVTDSDGRMLIDPQINTEPHDVGQQVVGQRGVRLLPDEKLPETVTVGGREYRLLRDSQSTITLQDKPLHFDDRLPGVEGTIHTMLAAEGRLFVVTREGRVYCFAAERVEPKRFPLEAAPLPAAEDRWTETARQIAAAGSAAEGYGLLLGVGDGRLIEELLRQTKLHWIVIDPDPARVDAFRRRMDDAGLYGDRMAAEVGSLREASLPPYMASLIVSQQPAPTDSSELGAFVQAAFDRLRPYGGAFCLLTTEQEHAALAASSKQGNLTRSGRLSVLRRTDALPGATDYTGQANHDALVRAPLGLLWFGDTFHHHKLYYRTFYHETGRGLPPTIDVADGVMKYEALPEPIGPNPPLIPYQQYLRLMEKTKPYEVVRTDVYTGQILSPEEDNGAASSPEPVSPATVQQGPPGMPEARTNPITGLSEARSFLKTYGCDKYAADYGSMLTLRSGTAAFYDKQCESGTINISGIRSGCRNSIVPACGVLCLPSWTGNCTCNYPCFTSMALVSMPEQFEQWTAWGEVAAEAPVRKVGINFGAPGDRSDRDGTLWLDWPSVGGPSPLVPVSVEPPSAAPFYRHTLWIDGGKAAPWVVGSGLGGVRAVRIEPVVRKTTPPGHAFSIRWAGQVEARHSGAYTFHVRSNHGARLWIDGKLVVDNQKELRRGSGDEFSGTAPLEAGRPVNLLLEYYQAKDSPPNEPAGVALSWSSAETAKVVIPADRLSTVDGQRGGLTGAYYDDPEFAGPAALQTDPQVRFTWAEGQRPEVLARLPQDVQLPPQTFSVYLAFAEPEDIRPGDRVFSVKLQGKEVLTNLDVVREAGAPRRGVVRRFQGIRVEDALRIEFVPSTEKEPVICGVRVEVEGR